jgi:hypothetical protein
MSFHIKVGVNGLQDFIEGQRALKGRLQRYIYSIYDLAAHLKTPFT